MSFLFIFRSTSFWQSSLCLPTSQQITTKSERECSWIWGYVWFISTFNFTLGFIFRNKVLRI